MMDPFNYSATEPLDEVQVLFATRKLQKQESMETSLKCINLLLSMSSTSSHRLLLANNPDLQVLSTLREVLVSAAAGLDATFMGLASKTCLNLSIPKENSDAITAPETGLLKSIGVALRRLDGDTDARMFLCGTLWNLSEFPENKTKFMDSDAALMDPLITVAKNSQGQCRVFVCGIFVNMSTVPDNKIAMAQQPGLLEALGVVIKSDKGQARLIVCGILMNFSTIPQIKNHLAKPEFELIPALLQVIRTDVAKARVCACGILMNISSTMENKKIFGANSGLLVTLVDMLNDRVSASTAVTAQVIVYMLGLLTNLSQVENNKDMLADEGLGLLDSMHNLVKTEKVGNMNYALGIMVNLSSLNVVKKKINGSQEMIDTIMNIGLDCSGVSRLYAICMLAYVTSKVDGKFLSGNFDFQKLFLVCTVTLQDNNTETRNNVAAIINNLSEAPTMILAQISKSFILSGLSALILNLLKDSGPDASTWPDIHPFKIINALMNFSVCNSIIRSSMLSIGALSIFQNIVEYKGLESRKAAFVIMNLIGSDEAVGENIDSPLYQLNPGFISMLYNVFKCELAEKPGKDYPIGTFSMKLIIGTLLELSISDTNKRYLKNHPFLNLLVLTLEYFMTVDTSSSSISGDGASGFEGGGDNGLASGNGGGSSISSRDSSSAKLAIISAIKSRPGTNSGSRPGTNSSSRPGTTSNDSKPLLDKYDTEVACLAIEAIFQLAFGYDDEADLRASFCNSQFDIRSVLKRCLEMKHPKSIPIATKCHISYIIKLFDKTVELNELGTANIACFSSRQAIICNEEGLDMDVVKLVKGRFDSLGYETAFMPDYDSPKSKILEEIVKSHTAIIFISKSFKRSPVCRFLASQLDPVIKKGDIKVVYVLIDGVNGAEELSPQISAGSIRRRSNKIESNGWLGIMIGNLNWFSILDYKQLEDIPKTIGLQLVQNVEFINNKCLMAVVYEDRKILEKRLRGGDKPEVASKTSSSSARPHSDSNDSKDNKNSNSKSNSNNSSGGKSAAMRSSGGSKEEKASSSLTLPGISSNFNGATTSTATTTATQPEKASTPAEIVAWEFLHDPLRIKQVDAMEDYLDSLGVLEAKHLSICDAEMFATMISFLKPIQKKLFVSVIKNLTGFELIITPTSASSAAAVASNPGNSNFSASASSTYPPSPENVKHNTTRVEWSTNRYNNIRADLYPNDDELDMLPKASLTSPLIPNSPAPSFKRGGGFVGSSSSSSKSGGDFGGGGGDGTGKAINSIASTAQAGGLSDGLGGKSAAATSNIYQAGFRTIRFVSELD